MKNRKKEETFEGKWYAHPPMRNALMAGLLTGVAFGLAHLGVIPSLVETGIYIVAIPLGGYHWSREGIEELLKEREIGIKILMMAATIGSAILGMWDEAAFLVFLYGAAEGLEEYTYARTRASIRKLLDLAPKEARVIRNGKEITIPAEELVVGDIFVVKPGESIPTDGIIVKGSSSINEAPVTGESMPVEKKDGMKVFAATINQEGALEIRATATYKDNTLAKMVHLVEEAQEQKSKTQLFIEKFGRRYSPLVLLSSLILLVIPPLLGLPISSWATRAVVLLVAAAPCALVMSTPVAIAAGIGIAGRSGVLIKGGIHLESLGKIKAIAFDKTGTLTKGKPVVTDVVALNGDESKVLALAYSVERFSEHPLAQAIVAKAKEFNIGDEEIAQFNALIGLGAKAKIGDKMTYVGKPELFKELGLNVRTIPDIERLRGEGKTAILVGTEEKIKAIEELEKEYGAVAMVGDGINDAPALARATVGIAMGTAGADAAIEAADTALMADDLTKVVYAINLGKRARGISVQNIVFSLFILAVLIPSALIGIMTVAIAVFFHEGSELLAVANGLRVASGQT